MSISFQPPPIAQPVTIASEKLAIRPTVKSRETRTTTVGGRAVVSARSSALIGRSGWRCCRDCAAQRADYEVVVVGERLFVECKEEQIDNPHGARKAGWGACRAKKR